MGTSNKPVIIFDTSGLNNLLNDSEAKILAIGVRSGYFVRQTETNLGEIISTGDPDQRYRLLAGARALLTASDSSIRIIMILERLIESYDTNPKGFDWGSPGRQSHHTGNIRTSASRSQDNSLRIGTFNAILRTIAKHNRASRDAI